ncbi:hypothetical protein MAHJHV54_47440 [Mycobacterium avium subsp. hominissuis]
MAERVQIALVGDDRQHRPAGVVALSAGLGPAARYRRWLPRSAASQRRYRAAGPSPADRATTP